MTYLVTSFSPYCGDKFITKFGEHLIFTKFLTKFLTQFVTKIGDKFGDQFSPDRLGFFGRTFVTVYMDTPKKGALYPSVHL